MTSIAAAFWNQIAETHELQSEAAKVAFRLGPNQLVTMDNLWFAAEQKAGMTETAASCLTAFLPLLTESFAINQWVSEHPEMRGALPEILSPADACFYAEGDYRPTPDEMAELERALSDPAPHLALWLEAATQARKQPEEPEQPDEEE